MAHLAELNIACLKYPLDDPRVAEFADNLELVNRVADRSDGFVWRLQDDGGNATDIRAFDDPMVIGCGLTNVEVRPVDGIGTRREKVAMLDVDLIGAQQMGRLLLVVDVVECVT